MENHSENPRSNRWNENVTQPFVVFCVISAAVATWLLAVWGAFVTR
jgi:hypothetical protein